MGCTESSASPPVAQPTPQPQIQMQQQQQMMMQQQMMQPQPMIMQQQPMMMMQQPMMQPMPMMMQQQPILMQQPMIPQQQLIMQQPMPQPQPLPQPQYQPPQQHHQVPQGPELFIPGAHYALRVMASQCFIDGRSEPGEEATMCDRDPGSDNQLQFKFEHCHPDHVSIMCVASGCYLHGRDADPNDEMENNQVMMSPIPPLESPSVNWRICKNKNGTVSFVCKNNGCYLDGRHGPGEILWITKRDFDPIFNPYFEWRMEQLA